MIIIYSIIFEIEQYESAFKSIFIDLDRYTWNIECITYIMDQLHLHLKELLETIFQLHSYQQLQFNHQLKQQQQQLQKKHQQECQQQSTTINTGLVNTASMGANVTTALLAATTTTSTSTSNNNNNNTNYLPNSSQHQSITSNLNNIVQQQNNDSHLINKLQELICTLIQVSKYLKLIMLS